MIREARGLDIEQIVSIHVRTFEGFFLTFLGERFLRLYYKGVINYNDAIKLVYLENNEVKGFIVGIMNPSGFYSTLLKRDWLKFGIASIPAVFKKPKSFFRLLRALTKPSTSPNEPNIAELSSLAVMPNIQGKGIGKELVKAFIAEVKNRGGKSIYLTTDADNNDAINNFYQKMGFKIERVFKTPEKRVMNEYFLYLESFSYQNSSENLRHQKREA